MPCSACVVPRTYLLKEQKMVIIIGTSGDDALVGGPELDTVLYINATGSVTVNLELGTGTGFGADTLTNIENVIGSAFDDFLVGDTQNNVLQAKMEMTSSLRAMAATP